MKNIRISFLVLLLAGISLGHTEEGFAVGGRFLFDTANKEEKIKEMDIINEGIKYNLALARTIANRESYAHSMFRSAWKRIESEIQNDINTKKEKIKKIEEDKKDILKKINDKEENDKRPLVEVNKEGLEG